MATADTNHIAAEIKRTSLLVGEFQLRSGQTANRYFDKYLFESDPHLLRQIAAAMVPLIPEDTEVLAGLEMGGIPVVTALSAASGLPAAFVRKEPKRYGTCKYAEGAGLTGRRVLIIEDVVSSGGAILDALRMLRDDDIEPVAALCVIDRQTGGLEALADVGVELRSLLTMEQIESSDGR